MLDATASIAKGIGLLCCCDCGLFRDRSGDAEDEESNRPNMKGALEIIAVLVGVG